MLSVQQMTGRIVSGARETYTLTVAESDCLQMLAHVADARAEIACPLGVLLIILKQMSVRNQHRSATTGICNYGRVIVFESIDVLPGQSASAFNITCMRMQCAAANLGVGGLNF